MAKQKLTPNGELDILTADELGEKLKVAIDEFRSGFSRPAEEYIDSNSTLLDANGNSGIPGAANNPNPVPLFEFKPGYTLRLHRLTLQFEGVAFNTTYSGYIYLLRAGRVVDFANLSQGVPVVFSYTSDAPVYRQQQSVDIIVDAGVSAAHVNVLADIQGTLEALPGQLVFN